MWVALAAWGNLFQSLLCKKSEHSCMYLAKIADNYKLKDENWYSSQFNQIKLLFLWVNKITLNLLVSVK